MAPSSETLPHTRRVDPRGKTSHGTEPHADWADPEAILENMADAFYAVDRDLHFVYVNRSAERLWNKQRAAVLGQPVLAVFPELAGTDLYRTLRQALADGTAHQLETIAPALGIPIEMNIVPARAGLSVFFRDISARRRMEDALHHRDDILTMAEESAGIGIWDMDPRTGLVRGTPQFFRLMGLPPQGEAVPIETFRRLRYPDDQARAEAAYAEAVAQGQDRVETEYRILRPDGQTRCILGLGRITRDAHGVPVQYCGVDLDITERRVSEAVLLESEARFRRVFEQSPLGKATVSPDFRLREVNPALCRMLGYTADELVGRPLIELVHPEDRDTCLSMGQALLEDRIPTLHLEERFLRRSGEPIWVRVNVGPIRDAAGRILYTLGVIEDINESKRITQALETSERRLREVNEQLAQLAQERGRRAASSQALLQAFFDNSPDWLTLQRATPDGRFVYADLNATCEAAYGLPRDRIIGRTPEDVLGVEGAQLPLHHLRECLRTGKPQHYVTQRTMGGVTRTIDVMFVLVPQQGVAGERFILTTARDITERAALEAQLRDAHKMEALGKLTSGVAHDFNNLLSVVVGNAELARRRPPSALPALMDSIVRAADRGATLTRQLLAFSRHQSANPRVLNLFVEMPRIAEMLRTSLRGNIARRLSVPADIWPVEVDPAELDIAILNVAVNARDAMPDGGQFTFEALNIPARDSPEGADTVALVFHDTGIGIPPDVIGKVFDPFFTTKEPGRGTGLGLSQVYGFARQSGGTAGIASAPGAGTTVTLRLPRTRKPPAAMSARKRETRLPLVSRRVLIVEDNAEVANVTFQVLRSMGLEVVLVDRARHALERLLNEDERIDLLLSDVVMPDGMNGFDLAREVRARRPDLPIILVTGYSDAVRAGAGAFRVLRKPLSYQELQEAISEALAEAACPDEGAAL